MPKRVNTSSVDATDPYTSMAGHIYELAYERRVGVFNSRNGLLRLFMDEGGDARHAQYPETLIGVYDKRVPYAWILDDLKVHWKPKKNAADMARELLDF